MRFGSRCVGEDESDWTHIGAWKYIKERDVLFVEKVSNGL
jgi:hypothetical protein